MAWTVLSARTSRQHFGRRHRTTDRAADRPGVLPWVLPSSTPLLNICTFAASQVASLVAALTDSFDPLLEKPDISVIDDEFRKKFETADNKNLQLEAVRRLISNEVKMVGKRNVVAGRRFSEMLSEALNRYQNRTIDAAQVIAEIVEIAKAIREQKRRGEETGLTENELAFYDAMLTNESARIAMEDDVIRAIAHDLTEIVRSDAKTDWQVKETVRAKLRTRIKRLLLKHGYPPDQEPSATDLIIQQAELIANTKQLCRARLSFERSWPRMLGPVSVASGD